MEVLKSEVLHATKSCIEDELKELKPFFGKIEALKIEKVYLMYMDEMKQVHWHLVPRYKETGISVFLHPPLETKDFSIAKSLRNDFMDRVKEFK